MKKQDADVNILTFYLAKLLFLLAINGNITGFSCNILDYAIQILLS
jgi:hypothetical protein